MTEVYQLPLFAAEKQCTKCGETKPLEAFSPQKRMRCGRASACKACEAAHKAIRRAADPAAMNASARASYHRHRDEICARVRARHMAHPERWQRYRRTQRARHGDKMRAACRAWMTLHYDEQRRRAHEYYQAHAEIMRERARAWRCANPEKSRVWIKQRRAQRRSAPGRYTLADIRALEVAQAGLCAYCRQPYGRYHIEHRQPLCHGGSNWPANLCLACATCNLRKHDKTEEEFRAWLARGYV